MTVSVFNIDDLNKENKELMSLLHKRYGQYRSQAYTCLMIDHRLRVKAVYEWTKIGKLKLDMFEDFCEDFIQNKFQSFKQDDVSSMIKFVKSL